jgi:hypothetical protein
MEGRALAEVGAVGGDTLCVTQARRTLIEQPVAALVAAWQGGGS